MTHHGKSLRKVPRSCSIIDWALPSFPLGSFGYYAVIFQVFLDSDPISPHRTNSIQTQNRFVCFLSRLHIDKEEILIL